jgi:hypothetical protein
MQIVVAACFMPAAFVQAQRALNDNRVERLMTVSGIDLTVALRGSAREHAGSQLNLG